jgi:hypothetical protein
VRFHLHQWRLVPRVLVLALIVTALPLPCAAEGASQPTATPGLRASIGPIARAIALDKPMPARNLAAQAPGESRAPGSKSFFKTPAGIVVLAIVAGGTGYAIYSAKHDRIAPTGR